MPKKFSPQALAIMEEILNSDRPYEDKTLARYVREDIRGEVIKIHNQKVVVTIEAMRYMQSRLFGGKPALTLVDLSENDKSDSSDSKNDEPQDLPEGEEAK